MFPEEDNQMLLTPPSPEEVKEVLWSCNLNASPGTDGISALLYKVHWDILGKYLSSIVNKVFSGQQPSNSQQTIVMIFATKPKKPNSIRARRSIQDAGPQNLLHLLLGGMTEQHPAILLREHGLYFIQKSCLS